MKESNIQEAANRLIHSLESGIPCTPVRELIGDSDITAAYEIQRMVNQHRIGKGAVVVGSKIGLTSFAVQKQLGVDQPDFGLIFADTEVENGGSLPIEAVIQPKAEAEVAFVLKKSLDGEVTEESVADAVDYAVAAIEIVGSRVLNWDIRITDTVADNASASHFVLGDRPIKLSEVALHEVGMKLYKNGQLVSEGNGAAGLGSPLKALQWLAETMKSCGTPLQQGDIILSGALGPMVAAEKGDVFEAEIDVLGKVKFGFN